MTPRRTKRLLLASAALSTAAAGCGGKPSHPPMGNPKGSRYDMGMYDAAPGDAESETPDAAPAPAPTE